MPITLGQDPPVRTARWRVRVTRYLVPLTLLLGLVLVLHIPRLRSGHPVDELSVGVPPLDLADSDPLVHLHGSQRPFILPSAPDETLRASYSPLRHDRARPVGSPDLALAQITPKRVAIVGAGASGSAAAFFLRRAARIMEERIGVPEGQLLGDVVVVDKEAYVGGRKSLLLLYVCRGISQGRSHTQRTLRKRGG